MDYVGMSCALSSLDFVNAYLNSRVKSTLGLRYIRIVGGALGPRQLGDMS